MPQFYIFAFAMQPPIKGRWTGVARALGCRLWDCLLLRRTRLRYV